MSIEWPCGQDWKHSCSFLWTKMLSELINFGQQFTLRETLRDQKTHNWIFPQSLADVFCFNIAASCDSHVKGNNTLPLPVTHCLREGAWYVYVMTLCSRQVYPPTSNSIVSVILSGLVHSNTSTLAFHYKYSNERRCVCACFSGFLYINRQEKQDFLFLSLRSGRFSRCDEFWMTSVSAEVNIPNS